MIKTECVIGLKNCDFIMATCSKCKSELRIEAGKQALQKCPICHNLYSSAQFYALEQISNALKTLKAETQDGEDIKIIQVQKG